jgi:hypothetical protein
MFKTLDLKYNKIEVNDESKETKCTQIIKWKISNPRKNNHCLNFWNTYWILCSHFDIERSNKVQYDYDNKLFLPK